MTLTSDIILDAYRESNLIAISSLPSAEQLDEGLTLLNRLRRSVLGTEAGEALAPIIIGRHNISRPSGYPWYENVPPGDWFLPLNVKMFLNLTSSQTIYLSPNPEDGSRFAFLDESENLSTYNLIINANGRRIDGETSVTFSTDGASKEYIFRQDTGEWMLVDPLVSTDEWPFPEDFDDMFVIGLAMRLNPRYVVTTAPESIAQYRRLLRMFKARYDQTIPVGSELGLIRTPNGRYGRNYYDTRMANSMFNAGYPLRWGYGYGW